MTSPLTYKDAGVDITEGNRFIEQIKPLAKATARPGVMAGLGSFGALFELPGGYQQPVLVSSTDGVGTKLKLAIALNQHNTIGIDLVAMCVNDIVVQAAEPLFFLDYFATGHLNVNTGVDIVKGISNGCQQAGCALIGGETAEMPRLYRSEDYDLAGFCVGIAEKSQLLDGSKVQAGDKIIGLASSGVHANGLSLVHKIIETNHTKYSSAFGQSTLGETLLTPTKIYVKPLLALLSTVTVHAMAHITGGGLLENIPRVLPNNTAAVIDKASWEVPEIFRWLQAKGNVANHEMWRTFNCGIGMVVILPADQAQTAIDQLNQAGEQAWVIGDIVTTTDTAPRVDIT